MESFLSYPSLPSAVVPLFIFVARVVDVTFGTMRVVLVGRGLRTYASILGFVEVFIWLLAISQVLQNLTGLAAYLSYSAGFATGTYVGMTIQRRLAMGSSLIRIVVPREAAGLAESLAQRGHRITHIAAEGARGPVELIFSVVTSRRLHDILGVLKEQRPEAFYTIEDVRLVREYDPNRVDWHKPHHVMQPFIWFRKGK